MVIRMIENYLRRISDDKLRLLLRAMGAVLIEGPKWCGKTSSAEEVAGSVLYMQDPDTASLLFYSEKQNPDVP